MVKARLTSNGAPVTSRLLELLLDGKTLRTASVDSNGSALLPIRTGELVKAHQATVTVLFSGGAALAPAAGSAVLNVLPARLTIRTVPAIDGIPIDVGTLKATTANGGVAVFAIPKLGTYRANADSPEQDARYQKLRALLEDDPEWNDGEIVYSEGSPSS